MKILLVLVCAFAFASAIYSPPWSQCGNSSDVWTPTNVTAQKDPENQYKAFVSACGTVNSHGAYTVFNRLEVAQNESFIYVVNNVPYRHVVPSGSEFCLNYTGDYSHSLISKPILVKITAFNVLGDEAGCVNMTLPIPVPESESEFLLKRMEVI